MKSETELDDALSQPGEALTDMMGRIDGDIIVLGVSGKMGVTLGRMAARAVAASGTPGALSVCPDFPTPALAKCTMCVSWVPAFFL